MGFQTWRPWWLIGLALLIFGLDAEAQHYPKPDCPRADDPSCYVQGGVSGAELVDNDFDSSNRDVAPAGAFVAAGSGYTVEAENCISFGSLVNVNDSVASNSAALHLPLGAHPFASEIVCNGLPAGSYYVWVRIRFVTLNNKRIWIQSEPFSQPPDNRNAGTVGTADYPSFTWVNFGSYDYLVPPPGTNVGSWQSGINTTNQKVIVVDSGGLLRLKLSPGQDLDCVYADTSTTGTPVCPSGIGGPGTGVSYEILRITTTAPASCGDARFAAATPVPWSGYNDTGQAACDLKVLWEDTTTDRLYECWTCQDDDLSSVTTTADSSAVITSSDAVLSHYRNSVSTDTKDINTFLVACNLLNTKRDSNWPSNTVETGYNSNPTCSTALTGDIDLIADDTSFQMFRAYNLGFAATAGQLFRGLFVRYDKDGSDAMTKHLSSSPVNDVNAQQYWAVMQLSTTVVSGSADTTPPAVPTVAEQNVLANSVDIVVSGSDNASATMTAKVRWSLTSPVGAEGAAGVTTTGEVGTTGTCTTSCNATVAVTGLPAATTIYYIATMKDQAGNTRDSTQGDVATTGGSTFYLSTTGSNTNNGLTTGTAWATFAYAVPRLTPGSTLIVRNGTYLEHLTNIPSGTSWQAPVTIRAENSQQATIRATNYSPHCGMRASNVLFRGGETFVVLDGLVFDGNNVCPANISFRHNTTSDYGKGWRSIRIQNSILKNAKGHPDGYGALQGGHTLNNNLTSLVEDLQFINNQVIDFGTTLTTVGYNHCVYFKANNSLFDGNTIYNCHTSGYSSHQSQSGAPLANGNIIRNNRIYNIPKGPCLRISGSNHVVYNNLCYNSGSSEAPITVSLSAPSNNKVMNNTVYNSTATTGVCIQLNPSSNPQNTVMVNNLCAGTNRTIQTTGGTGTVAANNLSTASPNFIDAANGDFRLNAGSPALNVGQTRTEFSTDFLGTTRPQGAAWDVGAFERP